MFMRLVSLRDWKRMENQLRFNEKPVNFKRLTWPERRAGEATLREGRV